MNEHQHRSIEGHSQLIHHGWQGTGRGIGVGIVGASSVTHRFEFGLSFSRVILICNRVKGLVLHAASEHECWIL